MCEQCMDLGELEMGAGILVMGLQENVAVCDLLISLAAVEIEVENTVDPLHIHREPLEPVGQLAGDGRAFEARDLLKIRELRYLHAVAPALPTDPPSAQGGAFPFVLHKP